MDSIGEVLKLEREKRGLTLEEAHEATKITIQSLAALEGDRFESFANKVYARAFLRDYANFLSLDSAQLLQAYEDKLSPASEPEPTVSSRPRGSFWRGFGYTVLVIVLVGGLGAGAYFAWPVIKDKMESRDAVRVRDHAVAKMPKAPKVVPPKPEAAPNIKSAVQPEPPKPVVPEKAVLEVKAVLPVWIGVKVDGQTVFQKVLPKGETKTFEGKKSVFIRAGMAGAVQLKFNGQAQPALGTLKSPGEKEFSLPPAPPAEASAPGTTATSASAAPAQPVPAVPVSAPSGH